MRYEIIVLQDTDGALGQFLVVAVVFELNHQFYFASGYVYGFLKGRNLLSFEFGREPASRIEVFDFVVCDLPYLLVDPRHSHKVVIVYHHNDAVRRFLDINLGEIGVGFGSEFDGTEAILRGAQRVASVRSDADIRLDVEALYHGEGHETGEK